MDFTQVGSAIVWATFVTLVGQGVSIVLLRLLGISPRKIPHVIEDVQNTAVGAMFFIISLIATFFTSVLSAGPQTEAPPLETALWIIGGLIGASIFTLASWAVAYRVMGRLEGESMFRYIRREIVDEQNAALAFFLGGLAVPPFIAILFQIW